MLAATMAPDLYGVSAPPEDRPARNGMVYPTVTSSAEVQPTGRVYDKASTEVSSWLGGFSAHVAGRRDRVRCKYASGEFSAVGPGACDLIDAETRADVFGPLPRSSLRVARSS